MAIRSRCERCNKTKFWFSMQTSSLCRECSDKEAAARLASKKLEEEKLAIREFKESLERYIAASVSEVHVDSAVADSLRKAYIALDIETTGLSPTNDRIIEIAAVLFAEGSPVKTFSSLINAGVGVPFEAYTINHITDEMLQSAPDEASVYPQLIEFLGPAMDGDILMCAHNASFDFGFLKNTFARLGYSADIKYVDTLHLARRCIQGLENYKQTTLVKYFGLEKTEAHRASNDALHCGKILSKLLYRIDGVIAEDMRREAISKWVQEAIQYWQQGEAARKNGQFDEAFALYDKAKAIDGAPAYLYESYALAYRKLKDYDAEINILSEGISKLPSSEGSHLAERRRRALDLKAARIEASRVLADKEAARAQKLEARQKKTELAAAKPKQAVGRRVAQCADDGTILNVFDTVTAAAKSVGVDTKGIRNAASGIQKRSGGFCWKYLESPELDNYVPNSDTK